MRMAVLSERNAISVTGGKNLNIILWYTRRNHAKARIVRKVEIALTSTITPKEGKCLLVIVALNLIFRILNPYIISKTFRLVPRNRLIEGTYKTRKVRTETQQNTSPPQPLKFQIPLLDPMIDPEEFFNGNSLRNESTPKTLLNDISPKFTSLLQDFQASFRYLISLPMVFLRLFSSVRD